MTRDDEFFIKPWSAIFRNRDSEHAYRRSRSAAGRRNSVLLASLMIFAIIFFALTAFAAFGFGLEFWQLLGIRGVSLLLSGLLLLAALKDASYRVLDRLTVLLAGVLVATTLAYTPYVDPTRVTLLARTLLFISFGYLLFPIALLPLTACMSALVAILVLQVFFFFELSPPERVAVTSLAFFGNIIGYVSARAMDHQRRNSYANQIRLERANSELQAIGNSLSGQVEIRDGQLGAAARELREQADQQRLLIDNLPVLIAYIDADERYRLVNNVCCKWHGRPAEEILNRTILEVSGFASQALRPKVLAALRGNMTSFTFQGTQSSPSERSFAANAVPHRGNGGEVLGVFVLIEDITERKRAEAQLQQAQKMEAVGQLTGGIAHDFNNLLTVVLGNAEMLVGKSARDVRGQRAIMRAAERGAELTRNLLAFSRTQRLSPQIVDLAELVAGTSDLLQRSLGETIEIATSAEPGLWPAMVDPGQLEIALLNLAINARDAMPKGGRLTIGCRNIDADDTDLREHREELPGDYVALAVADTGSGMDEETREHAFEPFYTTKDVGKGSGLGLSMVYGFAKQSGGHVELISTPGAGTVVRLYLPRAGRQAAASDAGADADTPLGRGEAVLVIEDDEEVRVLAASMLEELGYRVIEAGDASAAREILAAGESVDLVLSDVILPGGVSGPEFAREARRRDPKLPIVFMSGYTDETARDGGLLDSSSVLLNKPFHRRQLATALREALD